MIENDNLDVRELENKLYKFSRTCEQVANDFDENAKDIAKSTLHIEKDGLIEQIVEMKLKYGIGKEIEQILQNTVDVDICLSLSETLNKWKGFIRRVNFPQYYKIISSLEEKIKASIDKQWLSLLEERNEIDQKLKGACEESELCEMREQAEMIKEKLSSFRSLKEDRRNSFTCPYRIAMGTVEETLNTINEKSNIGSFSIEEDDD